jgi:hypothetical protein
MIEYNAFDFFMFGLMAIMAATFVFFASGAWLLLLLHYVRKGSKKKGKKK